VTAESPSPVHAPATLSLTLEGSPPVVRFERGAIDAEPWYQIVLQFGDGAQRLAPVLQVPPSRLLQDKARLQQILISHRIATVADSGVTSLLQTSNADTGAFRDALAGSPHPFGPAVEHRYTLLRKLRPFQTRDLHKLADLKHGANFSVPGAGKTTVTLALHARAVNAGEVTKLLVVAPYSAFSAWEEDSAEVLAPAPRITRWRPGVPPTGDVLLVAYQQLPAAAPHLIGWLLAHRTHLVIDEAHRAKRGQLGEWGRALAAIAPFSVRRDLLTGTPAPNHPKDLAALLDILWPGTAASRILPRQALATDPPESAMTVVQGAIAPLYVRTTKAELELPDPRIVREVVPMGSLQAQIYAALRNQYAGSLALDTSDQTMLSMMGEVTMYLLQAASSPKLLGDAIGPRAYRFPPLAIPEGSRLAELIETYDQHEVPAKVETACRIVHENARQGRKTLVWSNFPGNLLDLERQLAALQPALVYGAITTDNDAPRSRDNEISRFKTDPHCLVLLANPAAMSEGVSLHHVCHDAVYIDRTFNAGQYLQSLDRIHRLGLAADTETRVTLLVSEATIDGRVDDRLEVKTKRLSRILADPALIQMALPDDDDPGDFYDDQADLAEVLTHLATGMPETSKP
jgi:SNF2 family DNA or RNA helicase